MVTRKTSRWCRGVVAAGLLSVCGAGRAPAAVSAEKIQQFEKELEALQRDARNATESQVLRVLRLSSEVGRPYPASLALRQYLAQHMDASPSLLLASARSAAAAGALRTAVSRYKIYLAAADSGPEASDAAAELYTLLIDLLGGEDEAYTFMLERGEKFRESIAARKFDPWFLKMARDRQDYGVLARRLALVLEGGMPIEQERMYYWPYLDWLIRSMSTAGEGQQKALGDFAALIGSVREDPVRTARARFYEANLDFSATGRAKDAEMRKYRFGKVSTAAKAYFDAAPRLDTIQDICIVFGGGYGGFSHGRCNEDWEQKSDVLRHAFTKLSDADRRTLLRWEHGGRRMAPYIASPAGWTAIGSELSAWFKGNYDAAYAPFDTSGATRGEFQKQAAFLDGVPSKRAAVVNAVAAGDTLEAAIDHLVQKESWHLAFTDVQTLVREDLVDVYARLGEMDNDAKTAARNQALAYLAVNHQARTPLALFDPAGMRSALYAAWQAYESSEQTAKMAPLLAALDWVPYGERERKEILGAAYSEFRQWSKDTRRASENDQAVVGRIEAIEAAFQKAMNLSEPALGQAPAGLTRLLAEAAAAAGGGDTAVFAQKARQAYEQVKDYPSTRTAFGAATLDYICSKPGKNVDAFEVCLEIVADQLKDYAPDKHMPVLERAWDAMFSSRGWRWFGAPSSGRKQMQALNDELAKHVLRLADQNRFSAELFNWFRGSRRGSGWEDRRRNQEVMLRLIKDRALLKTSYRSHDDRRSAAVDYMYLLRHDFRDLASEYPVETAFDDMFVEEARNKQYLDWRYWEYGRDEEGKIAAAAAEILATYKTLPLGYGGDERLAYELAGLMRWHEVALKAGAAQRQAMLQAAEGAYGQTRFDVFAMGKGSLETGVNVSAADGRKAYFAALKGYLDKAAQAPARVAPPDLEALVDLDAESLTSAETDVLLQVFSAAVPRRWPEGKHMSTLALLVEEALVEGGRGRELLPVVPQLWRIARDTGSESLQRELVSRTRWFQDRERDHLSAAYSLAGQEILGGRLDEGERSTLRAAKAQAMASMARAIPVHPSDKRYNLYAAQMSYLTGKDDAAWDYYAGEASRVRGMFKELDPSFCIWLIGRHTALGQFDEAESLAQPMILWMDENPKGFDPEIRASLAVAYADLSFARQEYPRARAQYQRIAASSDFDGTLSQRRADLKVAEADRVTRNFSVAEQHLSKLARRRDRFLQTEANYMLARVMYDQEEYEQAMEHLDKVFALVPGHPDARILQGKVFLKMKKLMEATDVKVGHLQAQRILIPGRPLKVDLEDPNLATIGRSPDIEIAVWTQSGDEELFSLLPFGDSHTKFAGQIGTALAEIEQSDGTLQVLGDDKIYFDFSQAFKEKNNVFESVTNVIYVATDAELYASSGEIVSREEQEKMALDAMVRDALGMIEEEETDGGPVVALSQQRSGDQVKPGNKINVRVIDPDQSVTAEADEVAIDVRAASGDTVQALLMKETESHSGVYEGFIQTEASEAVAYASNSDEGRDPNFAISAGEYPAWVALPDDERPKLFTVDLYDNVAPDMMKIVSDVPGRLIKRLVLLTSMNGQDFTAAGSYPQISQGWDGSPRVEVVKVPGRSSMRGPQDMAVYLDYEFAADGGKMLYGKHENYSLALGSDVAGFANQLGLGQEDAFLMRLSGGFYTPVRVERSFRLKTDYKAPPAGEDGRSSASAPTFALVVDGQAVSPSVDRETGEEMPAEIARAFRKGVHTIEIYIMGSAAAEPSVELLINTNVPPYMVPCPAEMFDAAQNPEVEQALSQEQASVTPSEDGKTFEVQFPEEARLRVARLMMLDFETDAPAISRIELTDRDGEQVLPTRQDLMELRRNKILEIVPGDRMTVSYRDPKFISPSKELHEKTLSATFNNGVISASFIEVGYSGDQRSESYIPLKRYDPGDTIVVFIRDPDLDVSDELDKVKFTVQTFGKKPLELVALETGEHTGVFTSRIFPVETESTRPEEIQVVEGDDLLLSYMDNENTSPGIPWKRTFICEQVWYQTPELRIYDVSSVLVPEEEIGEPEAGKPARRRPRGAEPEETESFVATRDLVTKRYIEPRGKDEPARILINTPLTVEITWPTIAKSPRSTTELFVQTSSGRELMLQAAAPAAPAAGATGAAPAAATVDLSAVTNMSGYDLAVPGTVRRTSTPSSGGGVPTPEGYRSSIFVNEGVMGDALDEGRFTFRIPLELGDIPQESLVETDPAARQQPPFTVRGSDDLYVGFRYIDDLGGTNWITRRVKLYGDGFFDVMDRRYQEPLTALYVGEVMYFRVMDLKCDTSSEKDAVTVNLSTSGGGSGEAELFETLKHSGVFKGYCKLTYDAPTTNQVQDEGFGLFPVKYGDTVTAGYTPASTNTPIEHDVYVHKGADGELLSFTKRFRDPEIAVRTQFTLAEAYFELAKRHRKTGQKVLARKEIAQGKKMLEEALRDFPDVEARVQADYLLANLSLEFANDAENPEVQRELYLEAAAKFGDIVGRFPASPYAAKSQYKKGLVYEKMNEMDKASEEYVKLSYRYPDNELVAETIARLGQYFLIKGKTLLAEAKGMTDELEKGKKRLEALDTFATAGRVFGRLAPRFPAHDLAARTQVLSGQSYMRAIEYPDAVRAFADLIEKPDQVEPELVAEAMFWCAESWYKMAVPDQGDSIASSRSFELSGDLEDKSPILEAYKMYKRLTWDYPASKWAKYARGRLVSRELASAGKTLNR